MATALATQKEYFEASQSILSKMKSLVTEGRQNGLTGSQVRASMPYLDLLTENRELDKLNRRHILYL